MASVEILSPLRGQTAKQEGLQPEKGCKLERHASEFNNTKRVTTSIAHQKQVAINKYKWWFPHCRRSDSRRYSAAPKGIT